MKLKLKHALALLALTASANLYANQVINGDLIVIGSSCIGMDCVNGESFGFDTLRLKENNLRIKFQDTSSSGSFPTVDWQITANDSANGGLNKFSIDSIDNNAVPFTVEYGAKTNSVYIDNTSRVGFGTNNPVLKLHVKEGNTPALRLEQDGTSGFTPQTWDIAGNEANFFIRDATNGSKLPFKIKPGAPTNSLYVNSNGDIGLGTASPDAKLDIESGDLLIGNGKLTVIDSISTNLSTSTTLLENTNAGLNAVLLELKNPGSSYIKYSNSLGSPVVGYWLMGAKNNGSFALLNDKNFQVMTIDEAGNMDVKGTVTANNMLLTSDINKKENFQSINGTEILSAISKLAISKWNYKSQSSSEQHIGPMAQDFYQLFGLGGDDDKHISAIDSAGVSLAAIQALYELNLKKDQQIETLSNRIANLEEKTK